MAQVPLYLSWQHDFDAIGVDSLSYQWNWPNTTYSYPPIFLINRVLQKILTDETHDLLLLLPLWPSQSWWPTLMNILTEVSIMLPHRRWITSDPIGQATWTLGHLLHAVLLETSSIFSRCAINSYMLIICDDSPVYYGNIACDMKRLFSILY